MVLSLLKNSNLSTVYLHYKKDHFFYKMVCHGIPLNDLFNFLEYSFSKSSQFNLFHSLVSSPRLSMLNPLRPPKLYASSFLCLDLFSQCCTSQTLILFIRVFQRNNSRVVIYLPTYLPTYLKKLVIRNWLTGLWWKDKGPRPVLGRVETQESWWYEFHPKSHGLETHEEPVFHFKSRRQEKKN